MFFLEEDAIFALVRKSRKFHMYVIESTQLRDLPGRRQDAERQPTKRARRRHDLFSVLAPEPLWVVLKARRGASTCRGR